MITLLVLLTILTIAAVVIGTIFGLAKAAITIMFLPLIVIGSIILGVLKLALPAVIVAAVLVWAFSREDQPV